LTILGADDIAFYKVDGSTVSLLWDESDDRWEFNTDINLNYNSLTGIGEIDTINADLSIKAAATGASPKSITFSASDTTGDPKTRFRILGQDDIQFYKVDGTTVSLRWDESDDQWEFNTDVYLDSNELRFGNFPVGSDEAWWVVENATALEFWSRAEDKGWGNYKIMHFEQEVLTIDSYLDMNGKYLLGPADPVGGTYVGDRDYNDARYTQEAVFGESGNASVKVGSHRFYFQYNVTILEVGISVGTAPTGAILIVDVNVDGTTIFTTHGNRPGIGIGNFSGQSTTIQDASHSEGQYLTIDVDQIGSTIPGADLTVIVRYRRN